MQSESPTIRDLLIAKFKALLDECDLVSSQSLPTEVIDDLDEFFFTKGRTFLQETFEAKLQERIKRDEAAAEPPHCPKCKKNDLSRR